MSLSSEPNVNRLFGGLSDTRVPLSGDGTPSVHWERTAKKAKTAAARQNNPVFQQNREQQRGRLQAKWKASWETFKDS
jgi:hypothetical protein